jgi:hypothetical protein
VRMETGQVQARWTTTLALIYWAFSWKTIVLELPRSSRQPAGEFKRPE